MPQYIKSHSNYVLSKKHQTISDGTIWERDITTIGGVNQFSPGQIPIYNSNNFIITVRNDGKVANQYNRTKWKDNESGETWTLETVSGMTSEYDEQNDVKIVLKQDYYDFCDFAYYGSLTELFRSSINDVLQRFPGELYVTSENVYYTSSITIDYQKVEKKVRIGETIDCFVSNPFGIDIYSPKMPDGANPLKFFADGGSNNYMLFTSDDDKTGTPIENKWSVRNYNPNACKGERVAEILIDYIVFDAWVGDNNSIVYTSKYRNVHIRPKEEFIAKFYNECSNFEKLILNRDTTPKYKATFSVINENENGYYRKMEDFVFPTSYGGYNIDASSDNFNNYTARLSEIGDYYDSLFTDNLYRSMTHEAIKNFDWTYTREFYNGDEDEYVHGGQKMQKALRVFAREFDEILTYIDNIKNVNRVTYDERNNIPNYFLIDELENKGWDVCMVYPYDLEEYLVNEDGTKELLDKEEYGDEKDQLKNEKDGKRIIRQFTQNTSKEINPYKKSMLGDLSDGYFILPCGDKGDMDAPCSYEGSNYTFKYGIHDKDTYYDKTSKKLLTKFKSYSDERSYTYMDANNEFIRRMVINSPHIWRHKGTIEGIEMILGMFGLKSKRWVDRMPSARTECEKIVPDYEIIEYSSFANRIEDKWDAVHQMYRIDWINSTKAITYDYRSTSNHTKYGAPTNYLSYQGLPLLYRYEYDNVCDVETKPYIKVSPLVADEPQEATDNADEAFKNINNNNEPVRRRFLYPNFDKNEQLDGNPYFQMNGGWLSKTVQNTDDDSGKYNFQFDVDDNMVYTEHINNVEYDEGDEIKDNHPLYKETVRNIRRVDAISDLISTPFNSVAKGSVFYVSNVEKNIAVIDNEVFEIKYEAFGSGESYKVLKYVSLIKNSDYIRVGDSKFFSDSIVVYDRNGNEALYNLLDKDSGYEVKAYIIDAEDKKPFICQANMDGAYTIDSFMILDDEVTTATTNYFVLDDPYYSNRLASTEDNNGWRRLKDSDPEYLRINIITNYYEGNNPHNGNMNYDGGHEYFTYFKRLFKYPIDNDLFDERCYESFYNDLDNEIYNYGFSGLIDDNESVKYYSAITDTKIHYFGNYYIKNENSNATMCDYFAYYGQDCDKKEKLEEMYQKTHNELIWSEPYILNNETLMIGDNPYSEQTGSEVDEITNQILNNKKLTIKFYLHNEFHTNEGQCEMKYLDNIVTNYLTQMIPSTTIVDMQFGKFSFDGGHIREWAESASECIDGDKHIIYLLQESTDGGETWEIIGQKEVVIEKSPDCPQPTPPEREKIWVESATCIGYDEYAVEVEVYADDGTPTGEPFRPIEIIEENSEECGYVPCFFKVTTDASRVLFINPQNNETVKEVLLQDGQTEASFTSEDNHSLKLTEIKATAFKSGYKYQEIVISCNSTSELNGKKIEYDITANPQELTCDGGHVQFTETIKK